LIWNFCDLSFFDCVAAFYGHRYLSMQLKMPQDEEAALSTSLQQLRAGDYDIGTI
tara:strand:- start:69 stop:233 length:165 start_codon:yes stop_codon:yes gene_type:complete